MATIYKYYLDVYYEETPENYLRLYLEPRDKDRSFDFSKFRLRFRRKTLGEWYATKNYPTHESVIERTYQSQAGLYFLEIKISPEETLSFKNLVYGIKSSEFWKDGEDGIYALASNYKVSYQVFGDDESYFIKYDDVRDKERGDVVFNLSFSESYRSIISFGTEATQNVNLQSSLKAPDESTIPVPMPKAEASNVINAIESGPNIEEIPDFVETRPLYNIESSEASINSYGEPFEVAVCEDLEEVEVPFVCPDCVPNENYSEPFWQNEAKGFNYYNERECYYCVITDVNIEKVSSAGYGNNVEEYISKETRRDDQEDTYLIQALKILAAAYGKTQVTSFYKDSLELYTKTDHLVVNEGSGLTKVRICVQKREFELLPPDESPETDDSVQTGGIEEIELNATNFYGDIARIRAGMLVHKTFYETHLLKQKGYLYKKNDVNRIPVLSSTIEILRTNLRDFRKDLFHLIREKDYRINSFKSGLPFANNKVMKIKIKFDNSDPNNLYKIKFISVKPQGCRYRRIYDYRKPTGIQPQDPDRNRLIFENNPSA